MTKQYAERDAMALDKAGGHYMRHVMAMTREHLHGKGDIAAELGWRDMQIAGLQQNLDAVLAEMMVLKAAIPKEKDVDYNNDNMDDVSLAEDIGFNDAVTMMNRWKGETPATDAILNEVRAEGALAVSAKIHKAIHAFKDVHFGAVKECADIAEMVADELRTGSKEGGE